jgi:hypothetical protein
MLNPLRLSLRLFRRPFGRLFYTDQAAVSASPHYSARTMGSLLSVPLMDIPTTQSQAALLHERRRNQQPKGNAERKCQQYAMLPKRVMAIRPWRFRFGGFCPHFSLSASGSLSRRVSNSLYGTPCKKRTKIVNFCEKVNLD